MRKILVLSASFLIASSAESSAISPEMVAELEARNSFWEDYGDHCEGWSFPSKLEENGTCDDGDSVIFNGLLCSSGYEPACQGVKDSLDIHGQWWRSPRQVGGHLRDKNSFSRDQSVGVQLYLLRSKDQEAASRWHNWIIQHKDPVTYQGIKIGNVSQLCHDGKENTCLVTPAIWESMGRVWNAIGLPPETRMNDTTRDFGDFGNLYDGLVDNLGYEWNDLAVLELRSAKPGYQYHLKGVLAFIAKRINENAGLTIYHYHSVARELNSRQPLNLFFRYLVEGPSDSLAQDLISKCPVPGVSALKRQWSWERSDDNQAWLKSMGWDCVFLSNLLLEREKVVLDETPIPQIDPSRRGTVANQSFEAPLYLVGDAQARSQYLIARCETLVREQVGVTAQVTGLPFTASHIYVENTADVHARGKNISGRFSCAYQLNY